jgi:CRP-like cAMP-binding protein
VTVSATDFSLSERLSQHPYFRNLTPGGIELLASSALRRRFAAGEVLFLEGDPSAGLWVVERGRIKVYKLHVEGREHILHLFGPGDSFNEVAALDGGPNPANAGALSDAVAWVVPAGVIQSMLARDPSLAQAVIHGMSERMRMLVQQIEALALYAVQARLARFLIDRSEDPALEGPGITRAAIAAHLATTPETVSRALRTLEEAGAIRFDRHRIVIVDLALLRSLALL